MLFDCLNKLIWSCCTSLPWTDWQEEGHIYFWHTADCCNNWFWSLRNWKMLLVFIINAQPCGFFWTESHNMHYATSTKEWRWLDLIWVISSSNYTTMILLSSWIIQLILFMLDTTEHCHDSVPIASSMTERFITSEQNLH